MSEFDNHHTKINGSDENTIEQMAPSIVPIQSACVEACASDIAVTAFAVSEFTDAQECEDAGSTNVKFDIELPSILLTPDRNDDRRLVDSVESLTDPSSSTQINSPRLSYNSLLHWNNSPSKDDLEYLTNKYSELEGEILTVEIPLSQLAVEVGHAKVPQLGLLLAGNRDLNQMSVFVCGIRPGSIVERDGQIELGDQLLEVNDHTLYGLSHLNAAPIIRSIYLEAVQGSNRIFRRTKMGAIRFVLQRYVGNINAMAAHSSQSPEFTISAKSSRRSSVETVMSTLSTPKRSGCNNSKAKRSLQLMDLAFNEQHGPLIEHSVFITLTKGTSGFGFAIMEGSSTNEEGIYVKQIIPDGPAAKDGRLCPGDRLVRVNKKDATNASYESVLEWIRCAKSELRLQVKRWCYRSQVASQQIAPNSQIRKRFSAPQILSTLTAAFRGSDAQNRRLRSSNDQRDSLGSGKIALEPVLEIDDSSKSHLVPWNLSSQMRRASSPNLHSWQRESGNTYGNTVQSTAEMIELNPTQVDKQSVLSTTTTSIPPHTSDTLQMEPSDPPSTRPIVPGANTVIELAMQQGKGLGIGFIGGSETALNVLVVHELYANGTAVKDARLRPGDQILRVNAISLVGIPFAEAVKHVYTSFTEALLKMSSNLESQSEQETATSTPREPSVLTLEVRRPETDQSKWYDQELTVELSKKSGKGLGICIADRCVYSSGELSRNGDEKLQANSPESAGPKFSQPSYGVVITELVKGSLAASDGRLAINDQILNVNGEDTRDSNSEMVGALLKAAPSKVTVKVGRLKNQVDLTGWAFQGYLQPS